MTVRQYHHFQRQGDGFNCTKCGEFSQTPMPEFGCLGDPRPSIVTGRPIESTEFPQPVPVEKAGDAEASS